MTSVPESQSLHRRLGSGQPSACLQSLHPVLKGLSVRQLGMGPASAALGVRRTLAAIVSSRMGSRALLAGATPRVRSQPPT